MKYHMILLFLFSVVLFSSIVNADLLTNLTPYYSCDNAYTNTTHAIDSLLLKNATRTETITTGLTGKISEAYKFDGIAAYLTTPIYLTDYTSYTVGVWVNVTSDTDQTIIGQDVVVSRVFTLQYEAANNRLTSYNGVHSVFTPINSIVLNTWYYVVVTENKTYHKIYLNGNINDSGTGNINAVSAFPLEIGRRAYVGSNQYYAGLVDEVAIWTNRILNSTEIMNIYTNYTNGIGYPFIVSAPVIINSSYNLTTASDGENSTAWRNNNNYVPIKTLDTTPTITFNTTLNAYCRINSINQNWSTMGTARNCTTTGTTSHICTLPAADQYTLGSGYNSLFIGCIDSGLTNQTVLSTSGALNLSLGFAPAVSALQILPNPAFTDSILNCSFIVSDIDSSLLNVSINWNNGAFYNNFTNIINNSFVNGTWTPSYPKNTFINCNVTVNDSNAVNSSNISLSISNSAPYGFNVTLPINNSVIFANWTGINWVCNDLNNETLTATWFVNSTINGTSTNNTPFNLTGLEYDTCYNLTSRCGDGTDFTGLDYRIFCTNGTVQCSILVNGIVNYARYRNNIINFGLSCSEGVPVTSCSVGVNKFASEPIVNCSNANLTLEMGRNVLLFNVSHTVGMASSLEYTVYAKRLNDSGAAGYIVIIILVAVLGLLMIAYNNFMRIGAIAVLIGIGGCVLGTSILAFSLFAGGFVIMCSVLFALYEVMK